MAEQATIDGVWLVQAPEYVAFRVQPAGLLPRAQAVLLDLLIRLAIWLVLAFVIEMMFSFGLTGAHGGMAVIALSWFALEWFYHVFFESRSGQTPGKRAVGLRVVDRSGMPITVRSAMLRNLLRSVDWMPFGYLIGASAMIMGRGYRRLGDLSAGTLVIYNGDRVADDRPSERNDETVREMRAALPRGLAATLPSDVVKALAAYATRRSDFGPARRAEMARRLAPGLARRLGQPNPNDPDAFLCAVDQAVRQAAGLTTTKRDKTAKRRRRGVDRDGRSAIDLVEGARPHWHELEDLIADGQRKLTTRQVVRLADLYRSVCADLALAEAWMLPEATRAYLDDLVARGHAVLYAQRSGGWRSLGRLLFMEAPARLYRDSCLRVAMVAFFGTFSLAIVAAIIDPGLPAQVLSQPMVDQFEIMYSDSFQDVEPGMGRQAQHGAGATSFYITNNVGIALRCFAAGIVFGLGSLVIMVFNGIVLGLVFGYMVTADEAIRVNFFEFVTAHGPFELVGIALCGAAGLRLGWGMVDGRGLPLARALERSARQAIPILTAGALLVAMAAPIEGFISPSAAPVWFKRAVAVICSALMLAYFMILGRNAAKSGVLAEDDAYGRP